MRSVILGATAFVIVTGLLYGMTMAPSPRDGLQPLEFHDEAFYSVLGADLARTGREFSYSPAGLSELPDLPEQTWYHWGEIWLSAAAITLSGIEPILARFYVVLPLVLLAAVALTGTLVRRVSGTSRRGAFLFGVLVALFLAPIPVPGWHFASWARGLLFGITTYGLGAVTVLLGLYVVAVKAAATRPGLGLSVFSGATIASIIPMHIVLAALAVVGGTGVATLTLARDVLANRRLPRIAGPWREFGVAAALIGVLSIAWGLATGHALSVSGTSMIVAAWGPSWRESLALIIVGAGAFLALPVAWLVFRRTAVVASGIFLGTLVILAAGAITWGAWLGEFNSFHFFFGGLAAFATPAAAIAVWMLWDYLRDRGHLRVAATMLLLVGIQLEVGAAGTLIRLVQFGHDDANGTPVGLLAAIEELPPDAKLAYSCAPLEEPAFWMPRLLSITAHTGRAVIAMCFQAETLAPLNGAEYSADVENSMFRYSPQSSVYPHPSSQPSAAAIVAFLKEHGIHYIYADRDHPNSLVPDAVSIVRSGTFEVLGVP